MDKPKKKWRYGTNRWIVLGFIVAGLIFAFTFPPARPLFQVVAEPITPVLFTLPRLGPIAITNSTFTLAVVTLILILMAFIVKRSIKEDTLIPKGIASALDLIFEYLDEMTTSTAGKWAKAIFPFFATIVLVVVLSNWIELIPGVGSIGWLEPVKENGFPIIALGPNVATLTQPASSSGAGFQVLPFLRSPSTDLNFTLMLALVSVIMTQVIGFRAQGGKYFTKFFNTRTLFTKPLFGAIDLLVSLLEGISEIMKVVSFSFRLFGNIVAGSILLLVVGSLLPVFMPSMVMMFEFFIGLIQAIVFGMLTMVFMSMATHGHEEAKEEEEPANEAVYQN
jgi:F-type H+-transporting ATPase subunit a